MPDHDAEDPLRARSDLTFRVFARYLRWYFARHFNGVRIARDGLPELPAGRPAIIYTNHPSWWDPAVFILVMDRLLGGRIGFGPMESVSLSRYGIMRRLGVFGIDPTSARGAARFLDVSLRVLADPRNVLWITAEGAFTDARTRPVRLRPGLAHLARRVPQALIVPMAMDYVFWNERLPEVLIRFGSAIDTSGGRSVQEWTDLLGRDLSRTMDALAIDGMSRDPRRFKPLVQGHAGVGGVYDIWRRARASLRGEKAQLAHEVHLPRDSTSRYE